jgi:hypothetical protein
MPCVSTGGGSLGGRTPGRKKQTLPSLTQQPPPASMPQTLLSLAGLQVILIGRFWVIAEAPWT